MRRLVRNHAGKSRRASANRHDTWGVRPLQAVSLGTGARTRSLHCPVYSSMQGSVSKFADPLSETFAADESDRK